MSKNKKICPKTLSGEHIWYGRLTPDELDNWLLTCSACGMVDDGLRIKKKNK